MNADTTIKAWEAEGYDYLARASDGHVYPCNSRDIPRGAIDSYAPLNSPIAATWLAAAIKAGWTFGWNHAT